MALLAFFFLFGLLMPIHASDADFNGRWNLEVANEPRTRVWWLEVNEAGTPRIHGSFVGAPGGDVNPIPKIWIQNKTLVWQFHKHYAGPGTAEQTGTYLAEIDAHGQLIGAVSVEGIASVSRTFIGKRAPVITEQDDASWHKAQPIDLFNGHDLNGFHAMVPGKDLGWKVSNGLLGNVAGANNLVTDATFWNFELHAEFRLGKDSNSGIGLRGRYEVQILEDYGKPADIHGIGALYGRKAPTVNAGLPPGEWQTLDVRLVGRFVTVTLNHQRVIERYEIPGLTAIANDAREDQPGHMTIQGDHGAIEFRKLTVTPLVAAASGIR